MIDVETYNKLKRRADRLKSERDRAEGALGQQMEKLEELGCSTVEKAQEKLKVLQGKQKEAEEKYERELAKFQEKWGDVV